MTDYGAKESHGHGHGGDKKEVQKKKKKPKNLNLYAAYIHAVGDVIQSVGVMLAGLLIWCKPEWQVVDPMCTFLFSFLVLATTKGTIMMSVKVLMEAAPDGLDFAKLKNDIQGIPGVSDVHDLHIW
jgi:zinc transporter 2